MVAKQCNTNGFAGYERKSCTKSTELTTVKDSLKPSIGLNEPAHSIGRVAQFPSIIKRWCHNLRDVHFFKARFRHDGALPVFTLRHLET